MTKDRGRTAGGDGTEGQGGGSEGAAAPRVPGAGAPSAAWPTGRDRDRRHGGRATRAVHLAAAALAACLALGGLGAVPAAADHLRTPANYLGLDGNWFNPANWSTRAVPGPDTDVVLDGVDNVVIDPARGGPTVAIRDLTVRDAARLTTLPGTVFSARDETVQGLGVLEHRSTDATGDGEGALVLEGSGTHVLNPSPTSKRTTILTSTVAIPGLVQSPTIRFGLGGSRPAAPGAVGPGHYATLRGQEVVLGGRLEVRLLYGFVPRDGDEYEIIAAERITGEFEGLPEGALVTRLDNGLGLFIHYEEAEPTAGAPVLPKFKVKATIRVRPTGG